MSIFDLLFGRRRRMEEAEPHPLRETLFGDVPLDEWPPVGETTDPMPYGEFVSARLDAKAGNLPGAVARWKHILQQPGLDARHYLQAWHFLRIHEVPPPPEIAGQVLGVVVDFGTLQGIDSLAAYVNHSACFYYSAGAAINWEHPDTSLDRHIDGLIGAGAAIMHRIGFVERLHLPPPTTGQVLVTILAPGGSCVGGGSPRALITNWKGARILEAADDLMRALMAKP